MMYSCLCPQKLYLSAWQCHELQPGSRVVLKARSCIHSPHCMHNCTLQGLPSSLPRDKSLHHVTCRCCALPLLQLFCNLALGAPGHQHVFSAQHPDLLQALAVLATLPGEKWARRCVHSGVESLSLLCSFSCCECHNVPSHVQIGRLSWGLQYIFTSSTLPDCMLASFEGIQQTALCSCSGGGVPATSQLGILVAALVFSEARLSHYAYAQHRVWNICSCKNEVFSTGKI